MSHTPGPWSFNDDRTDNQFHVAEDGNHVVLGDDGEALVSDVVSEERGIANARLIAAAPDLLEALREMVAGLLATATYGLSDAEVVRLKQAEAAIARAEGG